MAVEPSWAPLCTYYNLNIHLTLTPAPPSSLYRHHPPPTTTLDIFIKLMLEPGAGGQHGQPAYCTCTMLGGMEANLEDHRLVDVLDLLLVLLQVAGHIYTLSLWTT